MIKFNDWSDEKLKEIIRNKNNRDSDQMKNMNYLFRILKQYLLWRDNDFDDNDINIEDFYFDNGKFIISCEYSDDENNYSDDDDYDITHSGNSFEVDDIDYNEMIEFLNNSEELKTSKKYNL